MSDVHQDIVHFVRLLGAGKAADAAAVGRRLLRQVAKERPDLAAEVRTLLPGFATSLVRHAAQPVEAAPLPVDADSRMELVRRISPASSDVVFRWPPRVQSAL